MNKKMVLIDNRYRVPIPKSLAEVLDWRKGDCVQIKLVNLELVQKLLSGEINLDASRQPIIIFNTERKPDEVKKKARTIFD